MKQAIKLFKFCLLKIIALAAHGVNGLTYCQEFTIFLLSVVERPKKCHAKFHDLVHEIIKGNIE